MSKEKTCSICEEPYTGTCSRLYPERIVIFPPELQPGDFLITTTRHQPLKVTGVQPVQGDSITVSVIFGPPLKIDHMKLPLLVKRQIVCGAQTCDLHCAKCADRPAANAILGTVESEKERLKRRRKSDSANARELIRPQARGERSKTRGLAAVTRESLNQKLKPHQQDIAHWAIQGGRRGYGIVAEPPPTPDAPRDFFDDHVFEVSPSDLPSLARSATTPHPGTVRTAEKSANIKNRTERRNRHKKSAS